MSGIIGFDISALDPDFKEHAQRGIGRYVSELRSYFASHASPACTVTEFEHRKLFSGPFYKALQYIPAGRQTIAQQLFYPFRLRNLSAARRMNIIHFPAHMDAPSWSFVPYVLTVLDLIPLVLADLYKAHNPSWRFHLARALELRAIRNAKHILAISESTSRDVQRLLGIPAGRITVTPLGVDNKFFQEIPADQAEAVRIKYDIPADAPLLLYVGGIDPRKNYLGLLTVLDELVRIRRSQNLTPPVLLMAGRISQDREFPFLEKEVALRALKPFLRLPGFVPDADLLPLYKSASVFLFLSLYEGFGLPVLEAMAAGAPVVAFANSSIPEVAGTACCLVEDRNLDAAVRAVVEIWQNPLQASEMRARGKAQARLFTWEKAGKRTMEVYEGLV